jgi:hypothetical protein
MAEKSPSRQGCSLISTDSRPGELDLSTLADFSFMMSNILIANAFSTEISGIFCKVPGSPFASERFNRSPLISAQAQLTSILHNDQVPAFEP